MTFTQIFADETTTAADKLSQIAEVVATAKAKYGNSEIEITSELVGTSEGLVDISLLSDNDKVAIAKSEARQILIMATELVANVEGIVLDRKAEELIAINPVLSNLGRTLDSVYL